MNHPLTQNTTDDDQRFCALGKAVITTEIAAVDALLARVDHHFAQACRHLLHCQGRIVVIGMGKSGHIANKIAATLASTGTPAFFVHPGEASHGDLGMITDKDVVLALSYSGHTREILTIVPTIKRLHVPLISLTGDGDSPLARLADVTINIHVSQEACPLGLAPTSSTTAMLVMGDALAIALLNARGFTKEDFARTHPAGALGSRLLLLVDHVMHTGDTIPRVGNDTTISQALIEITQKRLGLTTVVDSQQQLCGIYTDGDLRRTLDKNVDLRHTKITDVMSTAFKSIAPGTLAAEALHLMQQHKITSLIVTADNKTCLGVLHIHDLLREGVI